MVGVLAGGRNTGQIITIKKKEGGDGDRIGIREVILNLHSMGLERDLGQQSGYSSSEKDHRRVL